MGVATEAQAQVGPFPQWCPGDFWDPGWGDNWDGGGCHDNFRGQGGPGWDRDNYGGNGWDRDNHGGNGWDRGGPGDRGGFGDHGGPGDHNGFGGPGDHGGGDQGGGGGHR
ncbi:hypothetical protein [Mycobacterium sp.]|uniref:hypothetical protein n=1 Tax=Mycobacterium sp. TaxID=1785 RepID=UPI003C746E10